MANGPRWACCLIPHIKPIVPKSNHRKLGLKYWGEAPQKDPKAASVAGLHESWAHERCRSHRCRTEMKKVQAGSSLLAQPLESRIAGTVGEIVAVRYVSAGNARWMWHENGLEEGERGEHVVPYHRFWERVGASVSVDLFVRLFNIMLLRSEWCSFV